MLEFKLPEVGENIASGTVLSVAVSIGDPVKKNQDLLELETDKATIPVPSPCDGIIKEIFIREGEQIKVGSVIMKIEEKAASKQETSSAEQANPVSSHRPDRVKPALQSAPVSVSRVSTTPPQPVQMAAAVPPRSNESIPAQVDVPASPTVRRLARELGIMISQVPGTGPGGRISKTDVKDFARRLLTSSYSIHSGGPQTKPLPDFTKWGTVDRQPMNNIRKKTAEHLSYCWQTIPHVTQFDKADITELEKLRKERSTPQRKPTITPFILKIMAAALKKFPEFNASVDMETKEIVYKKYYHLGVAVDTDRGLLVPVIRNVDQKSIDQITDDLNEAAERARNRKTSLEELQGGCMTLTNLGGIGGTMFTPIVNWPEVAILGLSRGNFEPVFNKEKNEFVASFKLPLSLSYDHRIIDGADGARFIRWVCERIEQPFELD